MTKSLGSLAFTLTAAMLATAVMLHAAWMPGWSVASLVALIALRVVQRATRPARIPLLVRLALTAGMVAVVWGQFAPLGNRPVFAALLAGMLVLKLFETESVRDARLVVTFGCFLAMSAFLFGQGPLQTAATLVVVLLLFAALAELLPGGRGADRIRLRGALA